MLYLDFEIEIGPGSGREYPIQVLNSPAGEAQETLHFPYDTLELENRLQALQIALLRSGGTRRKTLTSEEKAVLEFGRDLFDSLFTGEVRSRYDVSQGEADRQGAGLRLKLRIQSPELAALPWEFLYDPREAEFICFSRNRPMVRYVDLPRPVKPLRTDPPLQILGMVVGPKDLAELDEDREKQRVEEALQGFREQGWVNLTWLEGGTWRDLQRALQIGTWHVFHFIGHGGFDPNTDEGLIALVDRDGKADLKSSTQIGRLLADHHSLRLVLLNACAGARGSEQDLFSSTAANLVRKGIPSVLAMQYDITDEAAIIFARGFYDALVNGMPIDAAVAEARKSISLAINNTIEWGTPVLYLRSPDGVIFDLARTKPLEAIPAPSAIPSEEADQQIRDLYNRANSAYWLEEWEAAARRFQEVVDLDPDYQDAASKLEQARRQLRLAELDRQAQAAREAADWPAATRALKAILAEDPDQREAAAQLAEANRNAELVDLYDEARSLTEAGAWAAALNVFGRIVELDPAYPDPDGVRARAEGGLAAQEKAEMLEGLHERALAEMDTGDWDGAREALREILSLEPGDEDAKRLLDRVESELAIRAAQEKSEKLRGLHERALAEIDARDWTRAHQALLEILSLEPGDQETKQLLNRVENELEDIKHPPPTPILETEAGPPAAEPVKDQAPSPAPVIGETETARRPRPVIPAEGPAPAVETAGPVWEAWLQLLADLPAAFDQAGWNLFGRWVAASTLGWIVTWAAATLLERPVFEIVYNTDLGIDSADSWAKLGLYLLAAVGLIFGQRSVLQNQLPGLDRWLRFSLVGWIAGLVIPVLMDPDIDLFLHRFFIFSLAGAGIGVLQWTALRERLPHAHLWIPASILAWILPTALGGGVFRLGTTSPQSFLPGVLVGVVTGGALVALLHASKGTEGIRQAEQPVGAPKALEETGIEPASAVAGWRRGRAPEARPLAGIEFDRLDWRLLGSWFIANAVGWAFFWGLDALIQAPLYQFVWNFPGGINDIWVPRLLDLILGAGFALAQALVIRRFLPGVKNWWILTFAGWEVGINVAGPIVYGFAPGLGEGDIGPVPFVLIIGTIIGLAQWLSLRGRLAQAWWWIPASTVAWGLAAAPQNGTFSMGETTFQAFLPGAILGLVSGLALAVLVQAGQPAGVTDEPGQH